MTNTILITGGSGGIGKQTAISLAKEGFHIVITGRSHQSCTQATNDIINKSKNNNVDYIISDFSSLKSIQSLANEYKQRYSTLDALVNNVGVLVENKEFTVDGLEKNFAINVLAPYLLLNLLLQLLSRSNLGKIVSLSGGMYPKRITFDNLQAEKNYLAIATYSHAKLVMMTLMVAFGKTIANTNVKSNICYPGQASTAMTRALTPKMFPWIFRLFFPILKFANKTNIKNPDKTAQIASKSSVYLVVNPNTQTFHNTYINYKCRKTELPDAVNNIDNQHKILVYANQIIKDKLDLDFNNLKQLFQ